MREIEKPCQWTLDGMSDPGVYPIKPWRCEWFLDQKSEKPMLSVKRWQVPLGSIYAFSTQDYEGCCLHIKVQTPRIVYASKLVNANDIPL